MKEWDYYSTVGVPYPSREAFATTFWYCKGECVAKKVGEGEIEYLNPSYRSLEALTKEKVMDDDAYLAARRAYGERASALVEEFKRDLFDELGIADNPRRDKLYSVAYDKGHAHGFSEVYSEAQSLVELIL